MKIKNRAELMAFLEDAEQKVRKYGWQNNVTHPYPNVPMTAMEIINECRDYDICTEGSREYLICLANGLMPIMEAWERYELAPKITVRSRKSGMIIEIMKDDLDMFEDLVEVI